MLNKQIPIKQHLSSKDYLDLNSIFYTIQGEGIFAGSPAVFIRLAGCNLQCPACDTDYRPNMRMSINDIVKCTFNHTPIGGLIQPIVVITGGEPFRQNITRLIASLLNEGYRVQIETNGTLFVGLDWLFIHPNLTIICSPKTGKVNKDLERHIKAYKYVIHADHISEVDGLPLTALNHRASPQVARPHKTFDGTIYVQPIDVQDEAENKRHLAAAIKSCMTYGYTLGLQMHKIIGLE